MPVGFKFYMPDPVISDWNKEEEKMKAEGTPKSDRPAKPKNDPDYPKKIELALLLLEEFKECHPEITVKCVLADALYGSKEFMSGASDIFEDGKLYEGWGQEAKQYGEEGSSRGLILSLLLDHCLLLHPEQKACIENKNPAFIVGSLQRRAQMDILMVCFEFLLQQQDPGEKLKEMGQAIKDVFQLIPSGKHMSGRILGRLKPTPSLSAKYCSC